MTSSRPSQLTSFIGHSADLAACAARGVLLRTPMIVLLFVALGVGMSYVVIIFATLLIGLLIPRMGLLAARPRRLLPALAGTIALAALFAGSLTSGNDPRHPATNNIVYALGADTGTAVWASTDQQPDAWTTQFFARGAVRGSPPEYFPTGEGRAAPQSVLQSEAPRAELAAPRATLLKDTTRDGRRTMHLRMTSPRRAAADDP